MFHAVFESAIPGSEWPQTQSLEAAVTVFGHIRVVYYELQYRSLSSKGPKLLHYVITAVVCTTHSHVAGMCYVLLTHMLRNDCSAL